MLLELADVVQPGGDGCDEGHHVLKVFSNYKKNTLFQGQALDADALDLVASVLYGTSRRIRLVHLEAQLDAGELAWKKMTQV
jgi:hypothetical protein